MDIEQAALKSTRQKIDSRRNGVEKRAAREMRKG